jgi:predicted GNAT family acetyltransferase
VDRIVVAPSMRGRGYARVLYTDLFEEARRAAHHVVVREVNSDPPNPASDASRRFRLLRKSVERPSKGAARLSDPSLVPFEPWHWSDEPNLERAVEATSEVHDLIGELNEGAW